MEISEILDKLFGVIQPVADHSIDSKRYENLDNYETAFLFLAEELLSASEWKDDNRASAQKIGKRTYQILRDFQETMQEKFGVVEED